MIKEFFRLVLFGGIIGVANAIPGVSGGTMAVVLGIYDKLIGGMSRFLSDIKGNLRFLAGIGIGALLGIKLLGTVITFCTTNYAMATNFFFSGLILGSIPMLYTKTKSIGKAKPMHYGVFTLFIGLMALLAFSGGGGGTEASLTLTPTVCAFLFFTSFISAVGMLLPGVSGSMLLLIFGSYYTVMNAIHSRDIVTLLPVAAGVGVGLLVGSRIIDICLRRLPLVTYYAILGMVIGSLISVGMNAFTQTPSMVDIIVSILVFVVGIVISLAFEKWNKKVNPEKEAAPASSAAN